MTPLATVAEMETRLGFAPGALTGSDLGRAEAALDDASTLVRAEAGRDFLGADGVTVDAPEVVVSIARDVALRRFRNPDGYSSEAVGSGAYTYRYSDDGGSASLTEEERRQIRSAVRALGGGSWLGAVRTPSAYADEAPAVDPLLA